MILPGAGWVKGDRAGDACYSHECLKILQIGMCEQHACVVASLHRKRAQVVLPADLIRDIDALVGENGRSEFVAEVAQREVQRRRFMQLLDHPGPGWNLE